MDGRAASAAPGPAAASAPPDPRRRCGTARQLQARPGGDMAWGGWDALC